MESTSVREIRIRLGLSQERFAQLQGVSAQTVRRWESGQTRPLPIISLRLRELEHQGRTRQGRGGPTMGEETRKRDEGVRVDVGLGLGGPKGWATSLRCCPRWSKRAKRRRPRRARWRRWVASSREYMASACALAWEANPS
ncbi:MAG: helix-turn-helix domain-containing protein [Chloroflexi bacterium]|nr:helix-turn-helix domain-containing protein [Chloroflexota bacterium]